MIAVGQLAPLQQWDTHMLDLLWANKLYRTGLEFKWQLGYPNTDDGCSLLVPGRYWVDHYDEINTALSRYQWVLFIRTSDEEDSFDVSRIHHPNARFWIQTPRVDRDYGDARLFGVGFPPHFDKLPASPAGKTLDVFLSAQDNHPRRRQCFDALRQLPDRVTRDITPTAGFTQGLDRGEYTRQMVAAKVVPCPSGRWTPDTFRLYEALEAHAIPIADDIAPAHDAAGYWRMLFPDAPFPVLADYSSLWGYITEALEGWPANANRIAAWWLRQKRAMSRWLVEDLTALGAL